MPACGDCFSVLLTKQGSLAACGQMSLPNDVGGGEARFPATRIPPLPEGVSILQVAAGLNHVLVLGSNGWAFAWGNNAWGQCDVPQLPDGVIYDQISAHAGKSLFLRSDGAAVACGRDRELVWDLFPPDTVLPDGVCFRQVAAGGLMVCLITSEGQAVVRGTLPWTVEDWAYPTPPAGHIFLKAACGDEHLMLLLDDGTVMGAGNHNDNRLDIPTLPDGLFYTDVSCGDDHTVLIRSDGAALAFGKVDDVDDPGAVDEVVEFMLSYNERVQIPELPRGMSYIQAAAAGQHTVLLRSDGTAVACGNNMRGQCNIPDNLEFQETLPVIVLRLRHKVVSSLVQGASLLEISCAVTGGNVCAIEVFPEELMCDVRNRLMVAVTHMAVGRRMQWVLPEPGVTLDDCDVHTMHVQAIIEMQMTQDERRHL